MTGKGDKRRPAQVPDKVVQNNWDNIFKKKEEPKRDLRKPS